MKLRQVGAVLAAASIVLAACGDDDDDDERRYGDRNRGDRRAGGTDRRARDRGTGHDHRRAQRTEAPAATDRRGAPRHAERGNRHATGREAQMMIQPGTCGLEQRRGGDRRSDQARRRWRPTIPAPTSRGSRRWRRSTSTASTHNGGIYGRPIEYHYEDETEIDPPLSPRSRPSSSKRIRCSASSATPR